MKRSFRWISSILVIGFILVGCSSTNVTPTASNPAGGRTLPTDSNLAKNVTSSTSTSGQVRQPRATSTATPTVLPTKTAAATAAASSSTKTPPIYPTPTLSAVHGLTLPKDPQSIKIPDNSTSFAVTTNLETHVPKAFQISTSAGQTLNLSVNGNANLQVYGPKSNPVSNILQMPGYFSLQLVEAGNYAIVLDGLGAVTLGIYLPSGNVNLANGAPLADQIQEMKIPLLPFSVSYETKLVAGKAMDYTFSAQGGQILTLTMKGNGVFVLVAPDGNTLFPNTDTIGEWQYSLPEDGTYTLALLGTDYVSGVIKMAAAPAGKGSTGSSGGSATRLVYAPGDVDITMSAYFSSGKSQTYILNLPAGQFYITTTGGAGVTKVTGPGNTDVAFTHSLYSNNWTVQLAQAGDYTVTFDGVGPSILDLEIPTPISY